MDECSELLFPSLPQGMTNVEEKSNVIVPAWDSIIEIQSNEKNFVFYYLVTAAAISNEPEILLSFILLSYYTFSCWAGYSKKLGLSKDWRNLDTKLLKRMLKEMLIMSICIRGTQGCLLLGCVPEGDLSLVCEQVSSLPFMKCMEYSSFWFYAWLKTSGFSTRILGVFWKTEHTPAARTGH